MVRARKGAAEKERLLGGVCWLHSPREPTGRCYGRGGGGPYYWLGPTHNRDYCVMIDLFTQGLCVRFFFVRARDGTDCDQTETVSLLDQRPELGACSVLTFFSH
jgi:hypothetical protein